MLLPESEATAGAAVRGATMSEGCREGAALVPGTKVHVEGVPHGPLAGLSFVAKDLFDVAGHPTGAGNPDWPRTHPAPPVHASVVARLLGAGATLIGKTITDELSLGLLGENAHHGTPRNPAAPARVPGGSSSGSVSAVASGLCDTALGTDTGGSVRVPASFCGVYGMRPSHGRIDVAGMLAQAPSFDTAGWFARDARTLVRVGEVMLGEAVPQALPARLLVAVDAFGIAEPAVADALAPAVERLGRLFGEVREATLSLQGLSVWARAQRRLQPFEAWCTFRDWLETANPRLAFTVARNLASSAAIPAAERRWAALLRDDVRARVRHLLAPDTVLCLPTTPFPAPPKGLAVTDQDAVRIRLTTLCCAAGLSGACQVSLPAATVDGLPVGLSLLARPGSDAALLAVAAAFEEQR